MEVLTSQNFDSKIGSGVVIVDFYADWCGPCRRLGPIFSELSEEMSDVSFFKVDVDASSDIAARFGVQSIPTIIAFKDGEQVDVLAGLRPKEQLADWVEKAK